MPLTSGQMLTDRYQIAGLLGQGGMGAVYQATDLRFNATVAIKENRLITAESQHQFAREAGLLYRLRHPNLPRVIDHFVIAQQGQYLVMDFVQGHDLKQIITQHGPLPEAQALNWMRQVLDALQYLHGVNIIHRDVKPANVKITPQGNVYLVDFGLAKVHDPGQQTTVGARGATPGFAPPEQYGAGRTDARTDVYSVAATLYALITGHTPPDALDTMTRQARFVPPRQINASISPHIEAAIMRAMQPVPDDRFQTVAELRDALLGSPTVEAASPASHDHTAPARPAPPPERQATRPPASPPAPAPSQPVSQPTPTPPHPDTLPSTFNWKRVGIAALVAAIVGTVSCYYFGPFELLGHGILLLAVLGLLIYHGIRIRHYRTGQYQLEILAVWLNVTFFFLLATSMFYGNNYDTPGILLSAVLFFWLPSAIVGGVILWIVRRLVLRKR